MRHLARRVALATILGVLGLGVLGMGGLGGGREAEPPTRDYRASFTDVDGTRIEVSRVTTGSDATLEGELGRGRLRIPFDNIERVTFKPSGEERDKMLADVQLRDGQPVTLAVRASTTFYGRLPSGAYQIRARDLRAVDFAH